MNARMLSFDLAQDPTTLSLHYAVSNATLMNTMRYHTVSIVESTKSHIHIGKRDEAMGTTKP